MPFAFRYLSKINFGNASKRIPAKNSPVVQGSKFIDTFFSWRMYPLTEDITYFPHWKKLILSSLKMHKKNKGQNFIKN